MTATIWNLRPGETVVAVDSSIWDAVACEPMGRAAKMWTLPHLNAVLAGGSWGGVLAPVVAEAMCQPVEDLDDLLDRLPEIINRHYRAFINEGAGMAGIDLDERWSGAVFFVFTAGKGWLLGDANGFEPKPLPAGLWADPEIAGSCRVHEPFQGDDQLVRLMRRQMDDMAGRHIGGPVIRAKITHDGLALATIGNLDDPVTQPEPTASGLSRQQRRALARKQRKA